MTPADRFLQFLAVLVVNPWILLKGLFLVAFLLYIAFAVIVVRQVKLMSQTLNGVLNLPLKLIAWVHLLVALIAFVLALIILP